MAGGNAQQRRQASARYPTMTMKTDTRTASNSLNRQQQSGTNLHMIGKPVQVSNPKVKYERQSFHVSCLLDSEQVI